WRHDLLCRPRVLLSRRRLRSGCASGQPPGRFAAGLRTAAPLREHEPTPRRLPSWCFRERTLRGGCPARPVARGRSAKHRLGPVASGPAVDRRPARGPRRSLGRRRAHLPRAGPRESCSCRAARPAGRPVRPHRRARHRTAPPRAADDQPRSPAVSRPGLASARAAPARRDYGAVPVRRPVPSARAAHACATSTQGVTAMNPASDSSSRWRWTVPIAFGLLFAWAVWTAPALAQTSGIDCSQTVAIEGFNKLLGTVWGYLSGPVGKVIAIGLAKRGRPPGALRHAFWLLGFPLPGWPQAPAAQGQRYSPWR